MNRRKKNGKFKRYVSGAQSVANVAHTALKTALLVKTLINVEYKHIDTAAVTLSPSSTGAVYTFNACGEGDASTERNGLSIRMKSLMMKAYLVMHASATNTVVRYAIVLDKAPNSAQAGWTDIFESNSPVSMTNNITNSRFRILQDRTVTFSGTGEENASRQHFVPLNHVVKYTGAGATNGDIEKNQLYLCIISNEATNTPSVTYAARVRYIDN